MRTGTLIILLISTIASFFFLDPLLGGTGSDKLNLNISQARIIAIKMIDHQSFLVENKGNNPLTVNDITVLVNNEIRSCSWKDSITTVEPGSEATCIFTGPPCQPGQVVAVASNQDFEEVYCT